MVTEIRTINDESLDLANSLLLKGEVVAFPTETVYGLGAWAMSEEGIAKIYKAKGRPSDNPLIVHVCPGFDLSRIVRKIPESAQKLMDAFWPGPMTLIMPKNKAISDHVTGGLDTVAVRMPVDKSAMALLTRTGLPIVAPSANTSGRPSPTTADHVYEDLKGKIPLILDGGACQYGLESTIVDLTVDPPMVLRPGAITMEMLRKVLPDIVEDPTAAAGKSIPANVKPKAPGMKYRHYAPKGHLIVTDQSAAQIKEWMEADMKERPGENFGLIVSTEMADELKELGLIPNDKITVLILGSRSDKAAIAANLFDRLREADEFRLTWFYGEAFERTGMGEAIMNRFLKASAERRLLN